MYKNVITMLCGLLLANPIIAYETQKNPEEKTTWRKYAEKGMQLAGAAASATASIALGKWLVNDWNSSWAKVDMYCKQAGVLQNQADTLLNAHLDTVAQTYPTLELKDANGMYTAEFTSFAKSFIPPQDPYRKALALSDEALHNGVNAGVNADAHGMMWGVVATGMLISGFLIYSALTAQDDKQTGDDEETKHA